MILTFLTSHFLAEITILAVDDVVMRRCQFMQSLISHNDCPLFTEYYPVIAILLINNIVCVAPNEIV